MQVSNNNHALSAYIAQTSNSVSNTEANKQNQELSVLQEDTVSLSLVGTMANSGGREPGIPPEQN